ncbi:STAS domain-containing protein [Fimbriimonas ginsengisoli]|uniref:Anti-sigma factor antagonist n=1 Tax=Fimbriimonas ginsengisoli Gsoil 348 TaxID=661478 RepID=A0A068NU57_FIMGI|nr:STAS domain-containing protein [Fimbriimonas ginsengisoli]AIE86902.1 Anti-sigma factor antagonist [Fimbriimonas ginsengisoli Gsoil 348]
MGLTIETKDTSGAIVAKVASDSLETDNVAAFRAAMAPILERSRNIVLDLSSVGFMDSTGLGSLLSCLRTVKSNGDTMKLSSLTPEVRQLFEMVLMDRVFDIYPDESAALAALA